MGQPAWLWLQRVPSDAEQTEGPSCKSAGASVKRRSVHLLEQNGPNPKGDAQTEETDDQKLFVVSFRWERLPHPICDQLDVLQQSYDECSVWSKIMLDFSMNRTTECIFYFYNHKPFVTIIQQSLHCVFVTSEYGTYRCRRWTHLLHLLWVGPTSQSVDAVTV